MRQEIKSWGDPTSQEEKDARRREMTGALLELDALLMCAERGIALTQKMVDEAHKDGLCKYSSSQIAYAFGGQGITLNQALKEVGLYRTKDGGPNPEKTSFTKEAIIKWFNDFFAAHQTEKNPKPKFKDMEAAIEQGALPSADLCKKITGESLQQLSARLFAKWETRGIK